MCCAGLLCVLCATQLPVGPAEVDLANAINETAAVETIVPDVCIEAKSCE